MKRKNHYVSLIVFILCGAIGLSACSKDDIPDPVSGDSTLTMKVDGEPWKASMTSLLTEAYGDSEQGDYHYVFIGGTRQAGTDPETGDVITEMMHFYVAIPSSDYKNPKGTYPITLQAERVDFATAFFTRDSDTYAGRHPSDAEQPVGVVEITDFKIGQQHVVGQPVGTEGYTRLSGTFRADLTPTHDPAGTPVKITDGKFDLSVGIVIIE